MRRVIPSWNIQDSDAAPSVTVTVPALTALAKDSRRRVIERAGAAGQLGALAQEIGSIEKARAASAADLPGKASRWEQLAKDTPDPVQAATYRQMARDAREQLANSADHLNKAMRYEQQAERMTTGADRSAYLELAKQERAEGRCAVTARAKHQVTELMRAARLLSEGKSIREVSHNYGHLPSGRGAAG